MLGEEYEYPDWAFPLGWLLTLSSVICIPLYMIYKFDKGRGGFKRVSKTGNPTYHTSYMILPSYCLFF